jgi:hypothetical protein
MELYNETHKVIKAIRKRFNIYHEVPCTADDRRVQEIISIVIQTIEALPSVDVAPKSKVAREIFEEIEKYWIDSDTLPDCARLVDLDKIAELKKKYTEE